MEQRTPVPQTPEEFLNSLRLCLRFHREQAARCELIGNNVGRQRHERLKSQLNVQVARLRRELHQAA